MPQKISQNGDMIAQQSFIFGSFNRGYSN